MSFATAFILLLLAALPGNLVDMYRAAVLAKSPKRNLLRVMLLASLVICPVSISVIIFGWWERLSQMSDMKWVVFVLLLWLGFCVILLYAAFRDYMLFHEKR